MGRGVSSGGGQSSLGYLFGDDGAPAPKPTTNNVEAPPQNQAPVAGQAIPEKAPSVCDKQIPAGILGRQTNNYLRADGQNTGNFLTVRIVSDCYCYALVFYFVAHTCLVEK